MFVDFLSEVFKANLSGDAIAWRDEIFPYAHLVERLEHWRAFLQSNKVAPGTVVSLEADFSPNAVALFLALVGAGCIVVPMTTTVAAKRNDFIDIAQVELSVAIDNEDGVMASRLHRTAGHPLYDRLRTMAHPGLVLFSSGSTGQPKAAVHDLVPLLKKFQVRRHSFRAISFLLYDHIGGINTMFYVLSNAGCLVTVVERSPHAVLAAVEKFRVELLPTTPTFLNLILISESYRDYDLGSLKMITYGTEPMPANTLRRIHEILPDVQLTQTYGLTEVGILRSKSEGPDSLWVRIGGEGFDVRVIDGILHIRSYSAMFGYLNSPSPFTDDGWFNTGDRVEVRGEYLRFLGRDSDIINVGGEKVYPAEVESVILEMENVADVTVYGEKNLITGQMVCARITLVHSEHSREFIIKMKKSCMKKLRHHEIPSKVVFTDNFQHGERFKRLRREIPP